MRSPSSISGVEDSIVVSLKDAEITFLANPSLILIATPIGVMPALNCFTLPSGKVIAIISVNFKTQRYYEFTCFTIVF